MFFRGLMVTVSVLSCCLGFVGCCAVPPSYHPVVPPPFMEETITAKTDAQPIRAAFGVPEGARVDPSVVVTVGGSLTANKLTLPEAVRETLQSDPKIRAGAENIIQAKADLWTAALPPNPTLTSSGTLLPWDRGFTVDRQGGPPQFDIGFSFPIDWLLFNKRGTAMTSAKAGVDVSGADYADLVRQRIVGTVAAFYDVLEAQAMLDLAREDEQDLKKLDKITRERVKLGGVGAVEIDRIRLAVLDSEREVRKRTATVVTAKAALRAQLGRKGPEPDFDVAGNLEQPKSLTPPPPIHDLLQVAEEFRPDIVSRRLQVNKAVADIRNEQRKAWPDVTPRFGYTRQFQQTAIGFPDASSWGIGMDIGVPVFDRKQGNILKAQSVLSQNTLLLQAQLVQVRLDLEQSLQDYRVALESLQKESPERIKTAESVRDSIEKAYKAGGRSYMEVIDAYRTYRDVQRNHKLDQSAYWHSLHRLNATIGKQVLP